MVLPLKEIAYPPQNRRMTTESTMISGMIFNGGIAGVGNAKH
jgi:hypothetical protein